MGAACSWWAPVMGEDTSEAEKAFDAHVCADHPPLKEMEKGPEYKFNVLRRIPFAGESRRINTRTDYFFSASRLTFIGAGFSSLNQLTGFPWL